jgi:hypothetical protein
LRKVWAEQAIADANDFGVLGDLARDIPMDRYPGG